MFAMMSHVVGRSFRLETVHPYEGIQIGTRTYKLCETKSG